MGGGTPAPSTPPPSNPLGSATLSWTAPTLNTDGSALSNLAGYEIKYGQSPTNLDSDIQIDGVGTTVRVIESLPKGTTWYFSIAARNSAGVLSTPSAPVSKVIS